MPSGGRTGPPSAPLFWGGGTTIQYTPREDPTYLDRIHQASQAEPTDNSLLDRLRRAEAKLEEKEALLARFVRAYDELYHQHGFDYYISEYEARVQEVVAQQEIIEQQQGTIEAQQAQISRLEAQTGGQYRSFRLISGGDDHREWLKRAIQEARSEIIIISPWLHPKAVNHEIKSRLRDAARRGVAVCIAWGYTDEPDVGEAERREVGRRLATSLRNDLDAEHQANLFITNVKTHEKVVICDDKFCIWGSFNWLSNAGMGRRRETSSYSEYPDHVRQWKRRVAECFRGASL